MITRPYKLPCLLLGAFLLITSGAASLYAQENAQENESNAQPRSIKLNSTAGAAKEAAPAPTPGGYNWTGFYAGPHIGYGWAKADTHLAPLPDPVSFLNLAPTTIRLRPRGANGGFQAGYNRQFGNLVIGGETDFSFSSMKKTAHVTPIIQNNGTPFPGTPPGNDITTSQKTEWFGTVRPRLGFAFNRFLVYGTGGLAYGKVITSANTDFNPAGSIQYPAAVSKTSVGWTAGGGVEIGIKKYLSFKSEYLFYDLGDVKFTANPVPAHPPYQIAYTWKTQAHIWNIGFNFHF